MELATSSKYYQFDKVDVHDNAQNIQFKNKRKKMILFAFHARQIRGDFSLLEYSWTENEFLCTILFRLHHISLKHAPNRNNYLCADRITFPALVHFMFLFVFLEKKLW